jgi:hypothetical protein
MNNCEFIDTCENKTTNCWEGTMSELHAKPIVDGKFWIVEDHGNKVGVLKVTEQKKYVFSSKDKTTTFDSKKKLFETFGKDFFISNVNAPATVKENEVHGYSASGEPHNPMFDVKRNLPLFTKSSKSKSVYCAGYYIIKFDKGWVKSFCPKLITIERYPYEGPFKTDLEMKQRLSNAKR